MTPIFFTKSLAGDYADEFRRRLPVNVNVIFDTLAPALALVEENELRPLLGDDLMNELHDYYLYSRLGQTAAAQPSMLTHDAQYGHALELLQMAEVRLAYVDSFDQLSVMIGDTGLSDQNGDKRVYRYQSDAVRENLDRQAQDCLRQLLSYLDYQRAVFVYASTAPALAHRARSLFVHTDQFDLIAPISRDRRVFRMLQPYIDEAETIDLPYRLGEATAAALIDEVATPPATPRFSLEMVFLARQFVAFKALCRAIPLSHLRLTPEGLQTVTVSVSNARALKGADVQDMTALSTRYDSQAERAVGALVRILKEHADTIPEIRAIGGDRYEHTAHRRDNTRKRSFFA